MLTTIALYLWFHFTFLSKPNVGTVFHISMLFGVAATYAIIATGLGYRATERVEEVITEGDVDVEHADEVTVNGWLPLLAGVRGAPRSPATGSPG